MCSICQCNHMLFSWEWERREGSTAGGLFISGSLPNEPSLAIQSLLSGLGESKAVSLGSHVDGLLEQISLLVLGRPLRLREYSLFLSVHPTVAPSNSIQSSIFNVKAAVTSSPASRSSKAVAESSSMQTPLSSHLVGRESWVPEPIGFLKDKCNCFNQAIPVFGALNHGRPRTRSYALIGTTHTTDLPTGVRCLKYWTGIVLVRCHLHAQLHGRWGQG